MNILVEEQMNYTFMSSLEHIALIRTAITLWNQDDIGLVKFYFRSIYLMERQEEWQALEDKVIEKVSKLSLPESLKKKVLDFIKPVGLKILKWKEYHERFLSERRFVRESLNKLCWTPQGTIDNKKTAEILIKDESLNIAKRYKLACIYCLENNILALWNKMPEDQRKSFYSKEDPRDVKEQELVVLWTYDIKGEIAKLDNMIEKRWRCTPNCTSYQYAFEYAAVGGNKAATEHFLQKLTPKEREESLVRFAGYVANRRCDRNSHHTDFPKEHYADVLCFLLSQLDGRQQIEVFKSYASKVLKCFLDWPWQGFFMKTAERMWDFLREEYYEYLLRVIVDKVIDGYKDYNYHKLFGEFWQQCPITHKEYVIDECAKGFLLSKLLQVEDKESIKLILKDATTLKREKIIFSDRGKSTCQELVYNNKSDLLKFFIQECLPSKDMVIKFKEELKKIIILRYSEETLERGEDMWIKFFQILDDLIQMDGKKRGMEEENSSQAKRLVV